tara:strand:+ start:8735 stop:11104 length:2370 start_codon:yes stop_codon:yes gene_type:complete
MKKYFLLLILTPYILHSQNVTSSPSIENFGGGVIITEIADPNESTVIRYIEIYNSAQADIDLSDYYMIRWTNGNANPTASTAKSLASACGNTLQKFQFCILSNKTGAEFAAVHGFYPDFNAGSGGVADSNGDDNIAIVTSPGGSFDSTNYTIIDAFGNAGTQGNAGQWHRFQDGRAERKSTVTNPIADWNQSANWNIDNDSGDGAGGRGYYDDFDPGAWIGSNDVDTWKGSNNRSWGSAGSWASGNVPGDDEKVWIRKSLATDPDQGANNYNNAINYQLPAIGVAFNSGSINKINKLFIYEDASLRITKDGKLTVTGEITNNGSLKIESDDNESGSLIAKSASQPTITFENYLVAGEWKLIGLPVAGEIVDDIDDNLDTQGGKSAIGFYDNDKAGGAGWVTFDTGSTDANELNRLRGYEIKATQTGSVSFTGTMQTGFDGLGNPVTVNASPGSNWNLVGNPFPSYLRMNSFAGSDGGGNPNFDGATDDFLSYNTAAIDDTAFAVYAWDGTSYDIYNNENDSGFNFIAPGAGFFVYAASNTNVTFLESMQVHWGMAGFHGSVAQGGSTTKKSKILIKMEDDYLSKKLRVKFDNNSTKSLDRGGDIRAFPFGESDVYMQLLEGYEDVNFAYQSLPYNDMNDIIIPIGIRTPGGLMKFTFVENTLPEYIDIYLEDTKNNSFTKLSKNFEINFDKAYEGLGRFYLHFSDEIIPELPTDNDLRIFKSSDNDIVIMGSIGEKYKAKIYDYSGRLISEEYFTYKTFIKDLDSKVKILRIESKDGLTIKKFKFDFKN